MKKKGQPEKHPLRSGTPCVKHRCVKCCIETRMPLSRSDVKRIREMGYRLNDFATRTQEGWQLKNRSGRCFFLSEDGCRIYPHRPEGCRLYPLVYDEDLRKAVLDRLCPHSYEFEVTKDEVQKLNSLLERLRKEKRLDGAEP